MEGESGFERAIVVRMEPEANRTGYGVYVGEKLVAWTVTREAAEAAARLFGGEIYEGYKMSQLAEEPLTWDNLYLLGWTSRNGRANLTTWNGDRPLVHVIVTGVAEHHMPMWSAPVPVSARIHEIPLDREREQYAKEIGGYVAFGWKIPVKREKHWSQVQRESLRTHSGEIPDGP